MENKTSLRSLVPFFVLVAGFFIYIAADQGLLQFPQSETTKTVAPIKKDLNESAVEKDLNEIKTFAKETRNKLNQIMSSLDRIDAEVESEHARLRRLIENLPRVQKSLASSSNYHVQKFFQIERSVVTNWNEFIDLTKDVTEFTEIKPLNEGDHHGFHIANNRLWKAETMFLLPRGLRLSKVISKFAQSLGAKTVSIVFEKGNLHAAGRAQVLSHFLKSLAPEELHIQTKEVDAVDSKQGLDIHIALQDNVSESYAQNVSL